MLGSTDLQSIFGSVTEDTNRDPEAVKAFIREATKAGLALLLVWPDSKQPADLRTVRQRNAEDKAAQEAAKAAGRTGWAKVKSPSGLALASTDPKVVLKYLDEYLRTLGTWHSTRDNAVVANPTPKAIKDGAVVMVESPRINLAIELGASRLVVVDCDTAAQVTRFLEWALPPGTEPIPPTVRTPGQVGPDGEWVHADGGHFYFTIPEGVELPTNLGAITMSGDDGFAVLWNRRYVLIPPSTRPEGGYVLTGREYPLPAPLLNEIQQAGALRAERATSLAAQRTNGEGEPLADAIDAWAESVPWSAILEPLDWTPTARPDNCGCEVWTAPGTHASTKSATAHDNGCQLGRYTEVNTPLHIWTDNPAEPFASYVREHGTQTISKLQAVGLTRYGGNIGKAMSELGLLPKATTMAADGTTMDNDAVTSDAGVDVANLDQPLEFTPPNKPGDFGWQQSEVAHTEPVSGNPLAFGITSGPAESDPGLLPGTFRCHGCASIVADASEDVMRDDAGDRWHRGADGTGHLTDAVFAEEVTEPLDPNLLDSKVMGVPIIAPFSHWRDMPPPEYIIAGLLEHGALSCLIGSPGVGKSSVALDMACHIATGKSWQGRQTMKTPVLYMPGEGLSGAVQRIGAWEDAHKVEVGTGLFLANSIIRLGASNEAWQEIAQFIIEKGIGLVIFDTFARMALAVEENSATEVGKAVERFDQIRRHTSTGVLIVHHTGKHSETARGSSALNGALDSELLIRDGKWDTSQIADANGRLAGKPIELDTTKQKNAEQLDHPVPLLMVNWAERNAPIITGPGGSVDPMQGEIVLARPVPEAIVETAIRLAALIGLTPEQGLSRAEVVQYLDMDPYTAGRADAPKAWRQQVAQAVDRALRYDLIQTLTGTASGQRYIPSAGTAADARRFAAAEVITTTQD